MRSFADLDGLVGRVPSGLVATLSTVDVGRGSEALFRDQLPGLLGQLEHRARVQSITASSAIEGIVVPDIARADRILSGQARTLRTRSEQEFAGYRDAQDYLFRGDWQPLNAGLLVHLHKLLFAHTPVIGGRFKHEDNLVVDRSPDGDITVRFRPVPAAQTDFYISELVDRYKAAVHTGLHHPVLLVGLFILDFLVIHPFEDGNGRVARAVTNALLMSSGYGVSRYVSLEQTIAESADEYYQALLDSTKDWHEGSHDPWPWLRYFVDVLAAAYGTFADRAAAGRSGGSKMERVRDYVTHHAQPVFRMADVRAALPGISDQTIRMALDRMRHEQLIAVDGLGRAASWRRIQSPSR
ncbi:Fic family protein [Allocatelliglobosispora scoriae]|uniref:Fic family protein n=1 Tax=Allocatelliglobosispora scoriae TaxID=643052 RepID=A0A841BQ12_9ACTN|nr:Fic family protein [Allocatelliglobosispora scoriae]MBB5869458.1 Fic family protein [Allocatelliglobosispora scoriae]